jgi:LuxR family maltose regulon positive regulatory protein
VGTDPDAERQTRRVVGLIAVGRMYGGSGMAFAWGVSSSADAGHLMPSAPTVTARRRRPVRRDAVVQRLAAVAYETPLVLLLAPAGYGKTTLLSQWADEDTRSVAWVQIDETDNDPARFLRHVVAARRRIRQPAGTTPCVLVLDDAHLLHHECSLDAVMRLVGDLPAGSTVVAAGRARPNFDLSRLPDGVWCAEFGREELSLTVAEVQAVVASVGLDLPRDAVTALRARTEGWPAGTYLAALSIAGAADAGAAARTVGGDDAFIADYFRDEVLSREPAEAVRFLMHTAPLDEMTASLCDAVLERSGSAVWLAEMERRGVFVAGQDRDTRWYRYHPLFAEMLRSELRRREPGEEQRVHRLATGWYEAHGRSEQAVRHALAGQDTATAARLISTFAGQLVNDGRIELVQRWLEDLGGGALEEYPLLATQAGWIWALAGNTALAHRCLLAAEAGAGAAGEPQLGTRLSAGTATLRTALVPHGVEGMVRDAQHAVALQPATVPDHARPAVLLGVAQLLNGAAEAGAAQLHRAAVMGRHGSARDACFALAQLALLAAEAGDWISAAQYGDESWALLSRTRSAEYGTSVPVHVARAAVALHRGDLPTARREVERALLLYAMPSLAAFPWLGAQMAIALGRLLLQLNDETAAETRALEAQRYLARLPTEGVLRGQYRRFAADLDHRAQVHSSMLTMAEMRILDLLPTHLTLSEIADRLFISRNTVKSHVAAVYRKLNASTRTQAVQEGRSTGLLES